MALPKVIGIVQNAKISAMINDKEVLEKAIIVHYQKYDSLPLLNEDQQLITLNNDISLTRLVKADSVISEDMKTIYTSLQETLNYYNDSEENLYRIDLSKTNEFLSKKLKYGYKKDDKDFYVYSTKTNNIYYYGVMLNGDNEIQHNEFNTTLKESELVNKKFSYNLNDNGLITNSKPIVELTTNLNNLTNKTMIKWEYKFIDEDKEPAKISFILNDVEYTNFNNIPTQLEEGEYLIKLKMQDSKGLWSNEIVESIIINETFVVEDNSVALLGNLRLNMDKNSVLWGVGGDSYDILGLKYISAPDATYTYTYTPFKIYNCSYIKNIYYGYNHVIVTNGSSVYAWGKNDNGQLGIGGTDSHTFSISVSEVAFLRPKVISLGKEYSMAIGNDDNLYGWGYNGYSLINSAAITYYTKPLKINLPDYIQPKTISAGDKHAMLLSKDCSLYSWGNNTYGELGIGNKIKQKTPQKVIFPNDIKVKSAIANSNYSMAICSDGNLYAWGYNAYGQLGIGNNEDQATPQLVTLPNGAKPKTIKKGNSGAHSIVIGNDGNIYSWGRNNQGQLGVGTKEDKTTPQLVVLPDNEKAKSIFTGSFNVIIKTESGNSYGWGYNPHSCLKKGESSSILSPIKLELP